MPHRNSQKEKTTKQTNGMKIKIPKLKLLTPALGLALLGARRVDKRHS
jgi:hypothetical protein